MAPIKNQRFADKHDFYKYDPLLKVMGSGLGFEQLVLIWMLRPDDPQPGLLTTGLSHPPRATAP